MPPFGGAIRDRWLALGGANSFLGNPTTDEQILPQEGRVTAFEHGAVYWWPGLPDNRAIDIGEMFVHFQGLNCFGKTDGPGADEPYVTIAATAGGAPLPAVRTPIFEGVEDGNTRPHQMELFRGQPRGMTILAQLIEHDSGNPENYRARMQGIAASASGAVASLIMMVPVVGPVLGGTVAGILAQANPAIADELGELLGLGDDLIGTPWHIALTPKDMALMAVQPNSVEKNVVFKVQPGHGVPLLEGHGGSYKVYFGASKAP